MKSSRDIGTDGRTRIAFDANTGALKGLDLPTGQYAGDTVAHWLTSLHMAKVAGLPNGPHGGDAVHHRGHHLVSKTQRAPQSPAKRDTHAGEQRITHSPYRGDSA
ncbi:MAG: hypothetical protein ACREX9_03065 [Gammaproteobacteria bacterium]